ncbi:hypothetical protein Tco_0652593 [Tanacetum coccineum]|uniref:Uncharacterized protein n=1 Tax=Tanacetum coccineum TaxID=301880 RepID=A0ABQ4WY39_9ASTR
MKSSSDSLIQNPEPMKEDQDWIRLSIKLHCVALAGDLKLLRIDDALKQKVFLVLCVIHENISMSTVLLVEESIFYCMTKSNRHDDQREMLKSERSLVLTIPDSSHQTVTSPPPVIVPF